jgi:hypothetical protein
MRWNASIHKTRPPSSNKGARKAWDEFVYAETQPVRNRYRYGNMGAAGCATSLPDLPPQGRVPKAMTYRFMDYWVWVMEFENGDYEEIDALTLRCNGGHQPK